MNQKYFLFLICYTVALAYASYNLGNGEGTKAVKSAERTPASVSFIEGPNDIITFARDAKNIVIKKCEAGPQKVVDADCTKNKGLVLQIVRVEEFKKDLKKLVPQKDQTPLTSIHIDKFVQSINDVNMYRYSANEGNGMIYTLLKGYLGSLKK